jgi:hypothetical protein
MSAVDELPRSREDHEVRLDCETLISDLSSRLANACPDDVDREIQGALRRVCESLGIDDAVLWQWSLAGTDAIVPTHFCFAQEDPHLLSR